MIRTKQIAALANDVVAQFLQNGQFPSVQAVLSGVWNRIATMPGTPLTSFTGIGFDTLTDPRALGTLGSTIAADVQALYSECIDQVNRIVRDFDYKSTRRARLLQRLVELDARLATVQDARAHRGSIGSLVEVDFAKSSAFLNFRTYTVELPPASNRTTKVDLSAAAITVQVPDGAAVLGVIQNIASDVLDAVWLARVPGSGTIRIPVTVSFADPQTFSKIVLSGHVASATDATLQLDAELLTTQTLGLAKHVEWTFAPRAVSTITLTLSKSVPDHQAQTGYYDFGIKSLSAYTEEYMQNGIFTTVPVDLGPIGTLVLDVDQDVPANCRIAWRVSLDEEAFVPLVPGQPLVVSAPRAADTKRVFPLFSTQSTVNVVSTAGDLGGPATDPGIPVLAPVRGGRTPLFTLCSIDAAVSAGGTRVWRGRNAWSVRSYHYSTDVNGVIQDPPPTINDMLAPRAVGAVIASRYQPTEFGAIEQFPSLTAELNAALRLPASEYPIGSETDRVMHLLSATLVVDQGLAPVTLAAMRATAVSLPPIFAAGKAAIYLNGTRVPLLTATSGGGLQYSVILNLQPGSNLLQIVTNNYTALAGGSFDVGTSVFSGLCAYGASILWYADAAPMNEVSLFELQYQTARNDLSRYARIENPGGAGQILIVRELPTTLYDVATTVLPADAPRTVALQATLSGSALTPCLTPRIAGYTLTAE